MRSNCVGVARPRGRDPRGDARVGHHDVQPAEAVDRGRDGRGHGVIVGHVGGEPQVELLAVASRSTTATVAPRACSARAVSAPIPRARR